MPENLLQYIKLKINIGAEALTGFPIVLKVQN